ncbi:cupredoxin domain-containing protein [Agrococcus sp. Marseille-P2731]|uniref:cupredoxin domain-containing protein n=1 Tax=Agrococcus sp. Marseille-P2731 TaxID=1841862 RepID=UPI00093003C8|nr:plastocyanin/azurin family copper-binding protein [Agrococcus sp. Marseille-P2731]
MPSTRTTISALLVVAALALTGCAASEGPADSAPAASEPAASGSPDSQPADESSEPSTDSESDDAAAPAATALTGMVGTAEDPEAYEIQLLDADGAPVTTLPAGDYTLTFDDRSQLHNFRFSGPGDVDVATEVAGTDDSTVEITLVAGTYSFVCDPHPGSMSGQVEVTG